MKQINILKERASEDTILANAKNISANTFGTSAIVVNKTIYLEKQKTNESLFESIFGFPFANVKKVSFVKNFRRCDEYKKIEGMTGNKVSKEKQSGFHTDNELPSSVRINDKTGEKQISLNYQLENKTDMVSIYVVDGYRYASEAEREFIRQHAKQHTMSAKQESVGVEEKDEIRFCQWAFSNIVAIGKNQMVEPIWKSMLAKLR